MSRPIYSHAHPHDDYPSLRDLLDSWTSYEALESPYHVSDLELPEPSSDEDLKPAEVERTPTLPVAPVREFARPMVGRYWRRVQIAHADRSAERLGAEVLALFAPTPSVPRRRTLTELAQRAGWAGGR